MLVNWPKADSRSGARAAIGLLSVPAVFKCQALDGETYTNIQRKAVRLSKRGGIQDIDVFGCVDDLRGGIVEPDVKDKRLLEHFNAPTPKEL